MVASETAVLYVLFAGLGGAAGAFIRFVVVEWVKKYTTFPAGVLIVNAIGTFLLAFTTLYVSKEMSSWEGDIFEHIELFTFFFNTGVFGSFTTFSTFSYNNLIYLEQKKYFPLAANMFLNITAGVIAIFVDFLLVFYIL